jgi:hypothetical protein
MIEVGFRCGWRVPDALGQLISVTAAGNLSEYIYDTTAHFTPRTSRPKPGKRGPQWQLAYGVVEEQSLRKGSPYFRLAVSLARRYGVVPVRWQATARLDGDENH